MRILLATLFVVLLLAGSLFWFAGESASRAQVDVPSREEPLGLAALVRESIPLSEDTSVTRNNLDGFTPTIFVEAKPRPKRLPPGLGRLRIQVDHDDQGAPKPSVRLALLAQGREDGEDVRFLDLSKGSERNAVLTDLVGQASFDAPAQVNWTLLAWEEESGSGRREINIPALRQGERRDLRILWERDGGLELYGVVRDALTNEPIREAQILLVSAEEALDQTTSSRNGTFSVWAEAQTNLYLRIQAEGYTTRYQLADHFLALLESGNAEGFQIELLPLSTLEVLVWEKKGTLAPEGLPIEVVLDLQTWLGPLSQRIDPSLELLRWQGILGPAGTVLMEGLPAGAPLVARVLAPLEGVSQSVRLRAGKRACLEFEISPVGHGSLQGALVDQRGEPISDQGLWLLLTDEANRYFDCTEAVMHETRTDEEGHFEFNRLLPASYLVGPRPYCAGKSSRAREAIPRSAAVAPMGTSVLVESGKTTVLALSLARGIYQNGVLLDAGNQPVAGVELQFRSAEFGGIPPHRVTSGEYALGPLVQAKHQVKAQARELGLSSEWVVVDPTGKDRVIQLAPLHGVISGVVRNLETDDPAEVWVHLTRRGEPLLDAPGKAPRAFGLLRSRSQAGTGIFRFSGLGPGEYSLCALDEEAQFLNSIPLIIPISSENGSVNGILLGLQSSAQVTFKLSKGNEAWFSSSLEIWSEESLLHVIDWQSTSEPYRLPPGRLLMSLKRHPGGPGRRIQFELAPGEKRTVYY